MKSFNFSLSALVALTSVGALLSACDGRRSLEEATFRVESVELEKTDVQKQDDFGLPQSKKFTFKACITDALSRAKITISRFHVSDGRAQKESVTNAEGCLEWTEVHTFSSVQQQKSLKMERTFTSLETYKGSVTVEMTFNPWQEKLVDLRKSDDPDFTVQSQAGEQVEAVGFETNLAKDRGDGRDLFARAALTDVKLDFNGHDVNSTIITPLLTLKPAQKFRLSLKPQFLYRNIKNEEATMDLKGGEFRLRLVIIGENAGNAPKSNDIVAYAEENMVVQSKGLAQKDILVRIHDVASVLSRNQFFLIVEPKLAGHKVVKPGVYKGFVGPLAGNSAAVDLIPVDAGTEQEFISSVETAMTQIDKKITGLELLASEAGMKEEKGTGVANLLGANFKTSKDADRALSIFCEKVYAPDQTAVVPMDVWFGLSTREKKVNLLTECRKKPTDFLRIERHDFVEDVIGKPRYRPDLVSTKSIDLSKNLRYAKTQKTSASRQHTKSFGWNLGAEVNAGVGLENVIPVGGVPVKVDGKISGGLRAGIGTDRVWTQGVEKTEENEVSAAVSEMQKFDIYSVGYDVKVHARTCVLLAPAYGEGGLFACAGSTQEKINTETYFQVNQNVGNTIFADQLSSQGSLWRVLVRGASNYKAFESLMTKGNGTLQFSVVDSYISSTDTSGGDQPLLPDFRVNQAFPGVLSR